MMKPAALMEKCEAIIKSFNPATSTLDSHAMEQLDGDTESADNKFVKQVLYGCVRYKNALKAFVTIFYHCNQSNTSRGDYTKFFVLAYLAVFRLQELGFVALRGLFDLKRQKRCTCF